MAALNKERLQEETIGCPGDLAASTGKENAQKNIIIAASTIFLSCLDHSMTRLFQVRKQLAPATNSYLRLTINGKCHDMIAT
jgi:hypothetical protein